MTDKSKVEEVTEGEKIWNEIKGKTIDIFALPDQMVSDHVKVAETFFKVDPTKCYVTLKA